MIDSIPTVICSDSPGIDDEEANGKPRPNMYLAAAKAMGRKPAECLVFERSYTAAKAARAAGMRVVVVTNDAAKFQNLATGTVPSLTDFDAMIWKLIPANSTERTFTGTGSYTENENTTASSGDMADESELPAVLDEMEPVSPSPYTPHPGHGTFRRKSDPPSPDPDANSSMGRRGSRRGSFAVRSRRRVSIKNLFERNDQHLELAGIQGVIDACPETGRQRRASVSQILSTTIEEIKASKAA